MSVDFNVSFAFSSFAFYTHFCILYMFTFALSHFITSLVCLVMAVFMSIHV